MGLAQPCRQGGPVGADARDWLWRDWYAHAVSFKRTILRVFLLVCFLMLAIFCFR